MMADLQHLKGILSMERKPAEEAKYLRKQYQDEAFTLAQDCVRLFQETGDNKAVLYWQKVCNNLNKHMH